MSNINDIRQLPKLYNQKEELERRSDALRERLRSLEKEADNCLQIELAKQKRFDEIISYFTTSSKEWWRSFYFANSPSKIGSKIQNLNSLISSAQKKIADCRRIDNVAFSNDINTISSEMTKISKIRESFAETAGYVSRKALCYNVCAYVDETSWTLKRFNASRDWGLHLCPKGIEKSLFKTWFAVTSPLGYLDIKDAIEDLPLQYSTLLSSQQKIQSIIKKYGIQNVNNPAGELATKLRNARSEIATATSNIEKAKRQIAYLQNLRAIVVESQEAFMNQRFDDYRLLYDFKNDYHAEMTRRLCQLSDYQTLKGLCDDIVLNVFDFKNINYFTQGRREKFQQAINDAPKEAKKKQAKVSEELLAVNDQCNEIRKHIRRLQDDYENILTEMTKNDPITTFFYQAGGWINRRDENGNNLAVKQIEKMAEGRSSLERLPVYEYLNLGGTEKPFLSNIEWQTGIDKTVNLIVHPLREDAKKLDATLWAASNLITTILLSMPIRKVHFTFIDFNASCNLHSKLFNRFNKYKNIYTVVRDTNGLNEVRKTFFDRTEKREDVTEIIVWTNYISDDVFRIKDEIIGILDNGANHGYFTIAVALDNSTADNRAKEQVERMCKEKKFRDVYAPGEDIRNNREAFLKAVEEYVNKKADTSHATIVIQESMENGDIFEDAPISIGEDGISVPIGKDRDSHQDAHYEFNVNSDTPQTFILGGSGSGKSYLLQNILLNAMLKYKAEDLEFYLMDFKMGAAEFRFYEGMPHVSHLLIDDADHQAVYEILSELYRKMQERGKIIEQYKTIANYNEHHPEQRLPYIVLVVDECHKLFESDSADRKMQDAINKVITLIVKEGRSQGVTFIFATQTFAGMEIPPEIKNEASNKYLMKVNTGDDAEKLFSGGSIKNSSLSQGYAYHEAKRTFVHIFDYTKFSERSKEVILKKNKRPEGRNNFVFSGKDVYFLPELTTLEKRYPVAYIGKSVSVKRDDITIPLRKKAGNMHMLITGANDELQAERVFFNAALSLATQTFANGKRARISIFDNPGDEDDRFEAREDIFNLLEEYSNVSIFRSSEDRLREMARLGEIVRNKNPYNEINILLILAQEEMKGLLGNILPAEEPVETNSLEEYKEEALSAEDQRRAKMGLPISSNVLHSSPARFGSGRSHDRPDVTMQEELLYLLKEGGESHVHVIMQVNRPGNILQDPNMVHRSDIINWFSHIVMLKCSQEVQIKLPVDEIRLDRLSDKSDMLRAVYVDGAGNTKVFTPYQMPHKK